MNPLRRKINCLIVEKEQAAAETITDFIQGSESLELVRASTDLGMVESLLSMIEVDLLFINVDEVSSDILIRLNVVSPSTLLMLLSASPHYQITCSELPIFDCLIKPLTKSRLKLTLDRLVEHFVFQQERKTREMAKKEEGPGVLIKSGGIKQRLATKEILYIESDGEYVKYHTGKGKFMALGSLKKLVEVLGNDFVQVHRSYVVNRAFVISKSRQNIELVGKRMIPIGKTYKNAFQFVSSAIVA